MSPMSPKKLSRRMLAAACLLVAAPMLAEPAGAQSYPERPIRIVNTFPAGGSGDQVIRAVFNRVTQNIGQNYIVDTRAGASGAIGTTHVARSAPDGYTLVLGTASTFGTNSATQKGLAYDPIADFTPVIMMADTPYFLLVHPSVPAKDFQEFLAHANANRGKLNFGSFGLGSSNHLAFELLKDATRMDIVHVPYKGGAPLITALLAGEVQASMDVFATAAPHIRAGRFRVLGVADRRRSPLMPEVPTLAEQGHPVVGGTFFALMGPARMPQSVVDFLNREVNKALGDAEVLERLKALGVVPVGGSPEVLSKAIAEEVAKWDRLVRSAGLKFD
jgi:tripartite-type tricarboxylate transporter receptor subunit TctC